jgi:hypothetical protein
MAGREAEKAMARDLADSVGRARSAGEQLGLFGGDPEREAERAEAREASRGGRKPGSRNKVKTGLAEYMAAKGYRAPGEALALAAGLTERGDPLEIAFRRALWLKNAALDAIEAEAGDLTDAQRALASADLARELMSLTAALWKEQNAAAAQLLPYTLQKLAPAEPDEDEAKRPSIGVATPQGAVAAPSERVRLAPADVRARSVEYQGVGDGTAERADGGARTDGASG